MVRWMLAALLSLTACGLAAAAPALDKLDETALQAAKVDLSPAGLRSLLTQMTTQAVDDAYNQKLLSIARLAGARAMTEPAEAILACYLRLRDPIVQLAVARAIAPLEAANALPQPQTLLNNTSPAGVVLATQILIHRYAKAAPSDRPALTAQLAQLGQTQAGWLGFQAAEGLKQLGDARYVELARRGLSQQDRLLRWAYLRLLEPADRPEWAKVFAQDLASAAGPARSAMTVETPIATPTSQPTSSGPDGLALTILATGEILDLNADGSVVAKQEASAGTTLAQRLTKGDWLMVMPTKFWMQNQAGEILWQCEAGAGPQNDVIAVGDGTWMVADGGSFAAALAPRNSALYVYYPANRRVLWRLPTAVPLSVRPGPVGTLILSHGPAGLAWVNGATGKPIRQVKLDGACLASETLPSGDVLAGSGTKIVRVNPAGAVTWSADLAGQVTSLIISDELNYLATVTGQGLVQIDATNLDKPAIKVIHPVKDSPAQARR